MTRLARMVMSKRISVADLLEFDAAHYLDSVIDHGLVCWGAPGSTGTELALKQMPASERPNCRVWANMHHVAAILSEPGQENRDVLRAGIGSLCHH
jgi:hypothetical protein